MENTLPSRPQPVTLKVVLLYLYPILTLVILELGCLKALHRVTQVELVRATQIAAPLIYLISVGLMNAVRKHESPVLYSQIYCAMALTALAYVMSLS